MCFKLLSRKVPKLKLEVVRLAASNIFSKFFLFYFLWSFSVVFSYFSSVNFRCQKKRLEIANASRFSELTPEGILKLKPFQQLTL